MDGLELNGERHRYDEDSFLTLLRLALTFAKNRHTLSSRVQANIISWLELGLSSDQLTQEKKRKTRYPVLKGERGFLRSINDLKSFNPINENTKTAFVCGKIRAILNDPSRLDVPRKNLVLSPINRLRSEG